MKNLRKKMSTTNKSSNKLPKFTDILKFVFTFYNKSLSECLNIGYRLSYNTTWSANKLNTSSQSISQTYCVNIYDAPFTGN